MPLKKKHNIPRNVFYEERHYSKMSSLTTAIIDGFKGRRSIYSLANESTISDGRLEEVITEVIKHTPSSFNSQTTRIVVLLKEENQKLWDLAFEVASSKVPAELFEKLYKNRITASRAAYGTVSPPSSLLFGCELCAWKPSCLDYGRCCSMRTRNRQIL